MVNEGESASEEVVEAAGRDDFEDEEEGPELD
jgi:hypothetical protein